VVDRERVQMYQPTCELIDGTNDATEVVYGLVEFSIKCLKRKVDFNTAINAILKCLCILISSLER
jgi:hypothetical protein